MFVPIPLKSIMFWALTPGNFLAIKYNDSPDCTVYSMYEVPAGIGLDACVLVVLVVCVELDELLVVLAGAFPPR